MSPSRPQIGSHSPKITARRKRNRQVLIDVAAQAFAQRGISSVSVDEVIDKAEIAKSTFYTFFRSKDELVSSILAPVFVSGTIGLENIDEDDADIIIEEVIEVYLYLWREYRHALYLINKIDDKYFSLIESEHHAYRDALAALMDRLSATPKYTRDDTDYMRHLLARCAVPILKVFADADDMESRYKTAMRGLLQPSAQHTD